MNSYPATALAKQLALSIFVENSDVLRQQLNGLVDVVATIELRLDNAPAELDLNAIIAGYPQFVFILCNRAAPQVDYDVDASERVYVDWPNDSELPQSLKRFKVIHSWHAHSAKQNNNLSQIAAQLSGLRRAGDLCKMVQWCDYVEDFELYSEIDLCFSQGAAAQFSRVVSLINEAPFMYVCLPNLQTAVGQFDLPTALDRFSNGIGRHTELCGVVGDLNVVSSQSPQLWHAAMNEAHPQRQFAYVPLPVNSTSAFLEIIDACEFKALSITNPHKRWADSFASVKSGVGVANFLLLQQQRYHAITTDGVGALQTLTNHGFTDNHKLLVIGNGGAAKSVVQLAIDHDLSVAVAARRPQLSGDWSCPSFSLEEVNLGDYDAFIQATTLGSEQQPGCILSAQSLPAGALALDMVYRPLETEWLLRATASGAVAIAGVEMLVEQFQAQFQLYNARSPLVLIGMRGSGKTTLGAAVADFLNIQFLDIDQLLEQEYQREISEWLTSDINSFRDCESEMLAAAMQMPNCVIATGGGVVETAAARELLESHPSVIWLQCSTKELIARQQQCRRPPLADLSLADEVKELLAQRETWYEKCSSGAVDTSTSLADSVEQACSFL
ncbi:MAG: hypothetical protein H8E25_10125 [Planctomycetes bacterium]|nr:hypothetical protein [Planctomycetota bacterium]